MNKAMLDALKIRRSVKPDLLVEPAPQGAELETILTIAARVPDHKKLTPWRFIVFQGEARGSIGDLFAKPARRRRKSRRRPSGSIWRRNRFQRAPLVIHRRHFTREPASPARRVGADPLGGRCCHEPVSCGERHGLCDGVLTEWIAYSPPCVRGWASPRTSGVVGFGAHRHVERSPHGPRAAGVGGRRELLAVVEAAAF